MNYGKSALAVAVAATLGGAMTAADAADHSVVLTNVKSYSNNGTSPANLTSSTATFHYDDVTNLVTQTGGTFEERYSIVENVSTLFRHTITGLVIGNGANAVGTTYVCTDGNFPLIFSHASFCGNYNFGPDLINDSTISYGPGIAFDRTMGGDDGTAGNTIQQSINQLNGMTSAGIVGTTLVLTNAFHDVGTLAGNNAGYDWTFTTDVDGDTIENIVDNCYKKANPNQVDSDSDGFGNVCDGDMNNNGSVNAFDTPLYRAQIGQPSIPPLYNKADINTSGGVNAFDTPLYRALIGVPVGPGVLP